MKQLLRKIATFLPHRIIEGPNGEPYLIRYFLFSVPNLVTCYLHRFIGDDPDRGFHNHPWNWAASIILAGRNTEYSFNSIGVYPATTITRPRLFNFIGKSKWHSIILDKDRSKQHVPIEAWSLFFHGTCQDHWGFLRIAKHRDHNGVHDGQVITIEREDTSEYKKWWKKCQLDFKT